MGKSYLPRTSELTHSYSRLALQPLIKQLGLTPVPLHLTPQILKRRRLTINSFLKLTVNSVQPQDYHSLMQASQKQQQQVESLMSFLKENPSQKLAKRKLIRLKAKRRHIQMESMWTQPAGQAWQSNPSQCQNEMSDKGSINLLSDQWDQCVELPLVF